MVGEADEDPGLISLPDIFPALTAGLSDMNDVARYRERFPAREEDSRSSPFVDQERLPGMATEECRDITNALSAKAFLGVRWPGWTFAWHCQVLYGILVIAMSRYEGTHGKSYSRLRRIMNNHEESS